MEETSSVLVYSVNNGKVINTHLEVVEAEALCILPTCSWSREAMIDVNVIQGQNAPLPYFM